MKYKNGKFKLLNVTCALFILLLVSSAASAQKVEVSEQTPEQLINTANMIIENTDIKMKFTSPIFSKTYNTSPYVDAYASFFTNPVISNDLFVVMLLANKMGAVSEIHIIQDDYESTTSGFSNCLATLCVSLGMPSTETSNMFKNMSKSNRTGIINGMPYVEAVGDVYSFSMKRRFIVKMRVHEGKLFATISATDY